jgi:hypothetical protein
LNPFTSRIEGDRRVGKVQVLFFIAVTLLPLWGSMVLVYLGGLDRATGDGYWAAAPWLVILSAPFCVLTLLLASATLIVYQRASGGLARRMMVAAFTFVIGCGVVLAVAKATTGRRDTDRAAVAAAERQALALVREDASLRDALGGVPQAQISGPYQDFVKEKARRFEVRATGPKATLYVHVRVQDGPPRAGSARVECIARKRSAELPAFPDVCSQKH